LIVYLSDIGIVLQIIGIIVALSVTRYLFHIALIIQVIYQQRKNIFPKIDFGHPKDLSELFLMRRVYSKTCVLIFRNYLRNIVSNIGTDKILKSGISNIMILIGIILVIAGLILTTTFFKNIQFTI